MSINNIDQVELQPKIDRDDMDLKAHKHELWDYLIGYGFSIILTLISFAVVVYLRHIASIGVIASILAVCAVTQVFVQLVYFLHIKRNENGGWNLAALLFTAVILLMVIGGSGWVMYYLHMNMMPELPI
ncbi:cytochrome o ubiquinol oxidase subunit IV [Ignatzschineria larvae DSM 13226]|nr:cytochrome o ubiquinol oxidase subunit IV [Ignatzschineria larvae]